MILSPALLRWFLPHVAPGIALHVDSLAIARTLLIAQMLPLAVGLGVGHWFPRLTRRLNTRRWRRSRSEDGPG